MLKFFQKPKIPLPVQFKLACEAATVFGYHRVEKILQPYGYSLKRMRRVESVRKFLTFTPSQLLEYLKKRPRTCQRLFDDCGDKRYSPSTFITMDKKGKYFVGMLVLGEEDRDVESFETLAEAVTDYVLFSLKMKRLKSST